MRFAAIALLLTSTNAAASKDMKAVLAKMSSKDLEAMAKHFKEAAHTKSLQQHEGPDVSDALMHAWDEFIQSQEDLDAELHKEHMDALDHAPDTVEHVYDKLADALDETHANLQDALSDKRLADTRKGLDSTHLELHESLDNATEKVHTILGKFQRGYDVGYKKALWNWKQEKPLLREKVQGLADAAEVAHADGQALLDKLGEVPEAQSFNKSFEKFAHKLEDTLEHMNDFDQKQWGVMGDALENQFHHNFVPDELEEEFEDFEHVVEDEFNVSGFAKKKAPATISMVNLEKAPKVQPEASYFGWGSMTLLVAALAGSAYTYNKVQKKQSSANDDMFSKVSENLMSA